MTLTINTAGCVGREVTHRAVQQFVPSTTSLLVLIHVEPRHKLLATSPTQTLLLLMILLDVLHQIPTTTETTPVYSMSMPSTSWVIHFVIEDSTYI